MKKITLAILFGLCSMIQAQKISTINMDQCFLKYFETINAEKILKKQVSLMEDRANNLKKNRQAAIAVYENAIKESTNPINSDEAIKNYKEKAVQKKYEVQSIEREMRTFNKEARDRLAKQHNESRTRILAKIKKVITHIAESKKLDVILDTSGKTSNLISGVVYSNGSMDITKEVISILNKGHEAEVEKWEAAKKVKVSEKK